MHKIDMEIFLKFSTRCVIIKVSHNQITPGKLMHGWRKMILSMGAGQLDLWSRVSDNHTPTIMLA